MAHWIKLVWVSWCYVGVIGAGLGEAGSGWVHKAHDKTTEFAGVEMGRGWGGSTT